MSAGKKSAVLAKELTEEIKKDFEKQTYPHKILLKLDEEIEKKLDDCDMVAVWDQNSEYGAFYLEDMINAFKYTNCDYITKDCIIRNGELVAGIEHNYVDCIRNVYATVFWKNAIECKEILQFASESEHISVKNGYSIDYFNYHQKG